MGEQKFVYAEILDVSESGLRVELREALARQAYVSLRADKIGLQGSASVRSCVKKGNKYVVGLEFSGGLKWKPNLAGEQPAAGWHPAPQRECMIEE